ncbi:MAG: MATE family efflux transporter, partial [Bacteroidetes bacterium]|nr:MATE family efflux transporter [Bacteroidota bacterium]
VWAKMLSVNLIVLGITGAIFIIFPVQVVSLITSDPEVVPFAAESLRIISYGFLFYGLGMVMVQAFNGAGDTNTPTFINFFCFWLLEIPLAWFLAITLGMQQEGVYFSIVAAESTIAIVALILFLKGKWKLKVV